MKKIIRLSFIYVYINNRNFSVHASKARKGRKTVKIGYFPNLTHIATIVALENKYFEEEFGEDVKIETKTVNNGGLFMEAMTTKAIDVGTVGPGPLLNFYVKNPEFHLISGAVNGGAVLVASEGSGINGISRFRWKKSGHPCYWKHTGRHVKKSASRC